MTLHAIVCLILLASLTIVSSYSNYEVKWTSTYFLGIDAGMSSEGDVYVVGTDNNLYVFDFLQNSYTLVKGDIQLNTITRVDVDTDGTPYVTTKADGIFYLNCYNIWTKLPGCANDISVGRGGEVWKIGCDARSGGYGIWKLFCSEIRPTDTYLRGCTRFRPKTYTPAVKAEKKYFWYRTDGSATRISVHPDGNPYVVTDAGNVFRFDGTDFNQITNLLARDIAISNEGQVFGVGVDYSVNLMLGEKAGEWAKLSGNAYEICAGPYSQPFIISSTNVAQTSSKRS